MGRREVCVCVKGWGLYPNRAPQARAQEGNPESIRPRGEAGMEARSGRYRCHHLTVQQWWRDAPPARTRASTMTSYLTAQAQARAKASTGPGEHGTCAPPSHSAKRKFHLVGILGVARPASDRAASPSAATGTTSGPYKPTPLHQNVPGTPSQKVTAKKGPAWCHRDSQVMALAG